MDSSRRHRARWLLAVAGVAALTLAGCGGSGGEGEQKDGRTQLTWRMWTSSEAEVNAWKHLADLVTAKYPDISVKFETTSFADYWTKLSAQAGSGDLPCVLGMQSLRVAGFGNLVRPLDDLLAPSGITLGDFDSSIVEGLKFEGRQVAIPYDFGPWMVLYDKTAFREAGLPEPKAGWTVEQFVAAAKKLTQGRRYGFAQQASVDALNPWVRVLAGGQAVGRDGALGLTDPAYVHALEWYAGLITTEKVSAQVASGVNATTPTDNFIAGNAAMAVDGPWSVINTKNKVKFEMGIAPMPKGAGGATSLTAGSGFGISRTCKAPEAAARAISVITGPEAETYLGEQGRAFPARTAQQGSWAGNSLPGATQALAAALGDAEPVRTTRNWQQVSSLFQQYVAPVLNGQQPAAGVLRNVRQQAG